MKQQVPLWKPTSRGTTIQDFVSLGDLVLVFVPYIRSKYAHV